MDESLIEKQNGNFANTVLPAVPSSDVYLEDCVKALKRFNDNYFDLAIVDPPYGFRTEKTGILNFRKGKQEKEWNVAPTAEYFDELKRVSKNQIVWGGNYFGLPSNRCFIIWDKVAHMDTLADCEYAWTSFDRNAKIFKHLRNTSETRIHICQKPIKLYEWLIHNYAKQGDKILDTHLGSGSSRIAADKMGFDFTGCELDKEYFEAQEKRFREYKSQTVLKF